MILPVTLTIAAAAAVLNLWLAMRIVRARFSTKVMTGDGGDPMMLGRMRAQANFIEYAPFVLILMALIELAGGSTTILWVTGPVFVAARVAHGLGMDAGAPRVLRGAGALLTWAVLAGLAGWALLIAYTGHSSAASVGVVAGQTVAASPDRSLMVGSLVPVCVARPENPGIMNVTPLTVEYVNSGDTVTLIGGRGACSWLPQGRLKVVLRDKGSDNSTLATSQIEVKAGSVTQLGICTAGEANERFKWTLLTNNPTCNGIV